VAREVADAARRLVIERARRRCEYCLVHEDSAGFPHQIDHIISRKHGGSSGIGNLAYACVLCNRYKGTDIASRDLSGRTIRFFDPRQDSWDEHFELHGPVIQPLTAVGEVTARMLRLNAAERVIERRLMQALGQYRKGLPSRP
jgi:HNH endonuclease